MCLKLILLGYFFMTLVKIPKTLLIKVALVKTLITGFIAVLLRLEFDEELSVTHEYNSKNYHFCCDGCKKIFIKKPKKWSKKSK